MSTFILPGACLLASIGCKKSNSTAPSTLTVTLPDSTVQAVNIAATKTGGKFSVAGYTANKSTYIGLGFNQPVQLNIPFMASSLTFNQPIKPWFYGTGGYLPTGPSSVTITTWDSVHHRISGNFNGEVYANAYDSVPLSNGKFDVSYSIQ